MPEAASREADAPRPASDALSATTTTSCGSSTIAVVPPYGDGRSVTVTPWRCASWETTNMPSRRSSARATTSNWGGSASWALRES